VHVQQRAADADLAGEVADVVATDRQLRDDAQPDRVAERGHERRK
jgi:hypothetical protein